MVIPTASFTIAESSLSSGLDAETLGALGDVQDLNLDAVMDTTAVAAGVLTKLVDSPAILAIPIGAGTLVAFVFGYFIYSYGQGRD